MDDTPVCPDWWPPMLWKLHFPPRRPGPRPGPINFPPAVDSILASLLTHTLSYMYLDKGMAQQVRTLAERSIVHTTLGLSKLHAGSGHPEAARTAAAAAPPNWTNDISKLFTPIDIDHMKPRGYDLSSYDDVKAKSSDILGAVSSQSMPPGNPWPSAWVNLFQSWIMAGYPR